MKKILALALAATTAFSMFGASLSASAVDYQDDAAFANNYQAAQVSLVRNSSGVVTLTVNQPGNPDGPVTITDDQGLRNMAEHIVIGDPSGTPMSYDTWKELNKGIREDGYGRIYMYDYTRSDKNAETDRTYRKALQTFVDTIADLKRSRNNSTVYTLEKFYMIWEEAYKTNPETGTDDVSNVRWSAINEAKRNGTDVLKYMVYDKEKGTYSVDEKLFDARDLADYNVVPLLEAVRKMGQSSGYQPVQTSNIIYVNSEYERVMESISFADAVSEMDQYYDLLAKIQDYESSDYTASAWQEVQSLIEEAEEMAAKATNRNDWLDALEVLQDADSVSSKAVDYTSLRNALLALYVDNNGVTKTSYIKPTYEGDNTGYYVYKKADFLVRGVPSLEWQDFAQDTGKYNNNNAWVSNNDSAYSSAYQIYKSATLSTTAVKQSQVDKAVERLNDAVDALTATSDIDEWRVVKLQGFVDTAAGYQESDFNITSRRWTTFTNALESAQKVLEKSNPSASELERVTDALENAIEDVKGSAKGIPTNTKNELKDTLKEADKLLANITTQSGAQVVALREANDDAYEVNSRIGVTGKDKAVISEVEAAIASLKEAIVNFNNPQGWNKVDGKWYYGVGADNYKGDWYKIGSTWFMFNDDGSMKASEWFQKDGKWYWANENGGLATGWAKVDGKWYYFKGDNSMRTGWEKVGNNWYYLSSSGAMVTGWNWINGKCYYFYNNGAMAASTTIGGYTVDASGAWVA